MLEYSSLQLRIMNEHFTICQISDANLIPFHDEYVFVAKTDEELSLVCRTKVAPVDTINRVDGFRALRVVGILPLDQIGIISRIAGILTGCGVSIFVVSTYNTDYILMQETSIADAQHELQDRGYDVITGDLFTHVNPQQGLEASENADEPTGAMRRNGFLKE
jgi:hypothetical protein